MSWIYHTILFFCPKIIIIIKIHDKRKLRNIDINHLASIYYKDFIKMYRKCTSEPCSFLTIDMTLYANNPLRFRKNLLDPL